MSPACSLEKEIGLSMSPRATHADIQNSKRVTSPPSRTHSILVIDDSADALTLQKILLGQAGYHVLTAESGEKAIQVLLDIDEPALILLDMQLGDLNGIDFLSVLEKKMPSIVQHVPVVFLTAVSEVPESKAIGFIRKPAEMNKFLRAVHYFVGLSSHAVGKC